MAGMFGLGAGWANVPVLNLVMGAPLKISVATSKFLLSITDTSAAWSDLAQVVLFGGYRGGGVEMFGSPTSRKQGTGCYTRLYPSGTGIMLGSLVGVRILRVAKPTFIRWMVIGILAFAGIKALTKGLGL